MSAALATWLALVLLAAAGLKAMRAERSAAALAAYGVSRRSLQRPLVWLAAGVELALAVALAAQIEGAAAAAAALFLSFTLLGALALARGRGGQPCACFGTATRLTRASLARDGALAALAAVLASGQLPGATAGTERWLTVGLAFTLAAVAALAAAGLALAREVGVLRLGMSAQGALEIEQEGPEMGLAQGWAPPDLAANGALVALAVFTSEGCPLCRRVAPAVSHLAGDPLLDVRLFDEARDAAVWRNARVPGSPYAVALDRRGVALAKGTFNSLAQLESIVATARARERRLERAA